ncbi:hypothetical protein BLNAU_19557 [Blattamonas nauphoetae]|uniref:Uncharacterized protein n=1 Tax=Blattamonas nauphoetae TaxID=2049346 RepID=A0ABQ9X146_9EUKA|nr:hypothetical protein BLNAU_19557 [Blattamonas nauphoetae]
MGTSAGKLSNSNVTVSSTISSLNHLDSSQPSCSEMNSDVSVSCSGLSSIDDASLVLGSGRLLSIRNTDRPTAHLSSPSSTVRRWIIPPCASLLSIA